MSVRRDTNPNCDLKLRFFKALVNIPVKLLDRVLRFPAAPHYPQTIMLMDTYAVMQKVYALEVLEGTFKESNAVSDGNFERMITFAAKIICQISERDRYYRAWIGLLVVMTNRQLQIMSTDPETLKRMIREQWDTNADVVPDSLILRCVKDFQEIALCDYLGNLANLSVADPSGLVATYTKKQKDGG